MKAVVAAAAITCLLAGCATKAPQVPVVVREPVPVRIPVPTPCIERSRLPSYPQLPTDAELAAMQDYELVIAIDMIRRRLHDYSTVAEAILNACTKPQ